MKYREIYLNKIFDFIEAMSWSVSSGVSREQTISILLEIWKQDSKNRIRKNYKEYYNRKKQKNAQ